MESILEYLAAGDSFNDILEEFSDLEQDDIYACFAYAAAALKARNIHISTHAA